MVLDVPGAGCPGAGCLMVLDVSGCWMSRVLDVWVLDVQKLDVQVLDVCESHHPLIQTNKQCSLSYKKNMMIYVATYIYHHVGTI